MLEFQPEIVKFMLCSIGLALNLYCTNDLILQEKVV